MRRNIEIRQPGHTVGAPSAMNDPSLSIISSSSTPPGRLFATLPLFHLPAPRRLSFLQLFYPFRLPRRCLIGNHFSSNLEDQRVQSSKAGGSIVGLFPRVVGLNDQGVGLGRMVA